MKHVLWVVLLAAAVPVRAAGAEKLGVGVVLGVPFGATAKYWLDPVYAVQSHLGVSDGNLMVNADLLRNFDDVLPRRDPGHRMPLYAGLGLKYKSERRDFVGLRFVGGVSMFHSKKPIEFFAEIAPVLRLAPSADGAFDGAVGVRRYF